MQSKYEFQISVGEINVKFKSKRKLIVSEEFFPFMYQQKRNNKQQIFIYVDDCNEDKCKTILNNCLEISRGRSYACYRKENEYIIVFGPRYIKQERFDCFAKDLWYLVCDSNFSYCTLYIPDIYSYDEINLSYELFERPWLQKLVVCKIEGKEWFILHGAAIQMDKTGLLILGDSGVGKSTLCKICESTNKKVIADDRIMLNVQHNFVKAYGTPWNRKNKKYAINDSIIIQKTLFISHGKSNIVYKNTSFKKYLIPIIKQLYFPICFENNDRINLRFSKAMFLLNRLESYKFEFLPDKTAVEYLSQYFEDRGKIK